MVYSENSITAPLRAAFYCYCESFQRVPTPCGCATSSRPSRFLLWCRVPVPDTCLHRRSIVIPISRTADGIRLLSYFSSKLVTRFFFYTSRFLFCLLPFDFCLAFLCDLCAFSANFVVNAFLLFSRNSQLLFTVFFENRITAPSRALEFPYRSMIPGDSSRP